MTQSVSIMISVRVTSDLNDHTLQLGSCDLMMMMDMDSRLY